MESRYNLTNQETNGVSHCKNTDIDREWPVPVMFLNHYLKFKFNFNKKCMEADNPEPPPPPGQNDRRLWKYYSTPNFVCVR